MAWDNEGTRASDYGTCAPCGNTYHADDPAWANDTPAGRDPICRNCDDEEKEDDLPSRQAAETWEESGVLNLPWDVRLILDAYVSGELKTAAEWRKAIDYEAHERMLQRLVGGLLEGNDADTSIVEMGVFSRRMVAAAIATGVTL